jgi:SAM-dependent methyltransferase
MPQITDYPRYAWQLASRTRAAMESESFERRKRDLAPYLDFSRPLDVLDVGNGRLRPQYAIGRSAGHRVVGVDFVNRPRHGWIDLAYTGVRQLYARQLGLKPGAMEPCALIGADVGQLPLPDASFDLAVSTAAFEHFLDVPGVIAELRRVLRPGGLVWVAIHLFTSPSGGHNLSFTEYPLVTMPRGVDPWDHLRQRRLPFSVPLNEWRKQQYREAFAQHFELLRDYCGLREGERWLTPEVERELSSYTRDELTCAAYIVIARKPRE